MDLLANEQCTDPKTIADILGMFIENVNGCLFMLINPLYYMNLLSHKSNIVAVNNSTIFCQNSTITAIVGSNGWCLINNGSYSGFWWKAQLEWLEQTLPFC